MVLTENLSVQYHGGEICPDCGHKKGEGQFMVPNAFTSRRHLRPVMDDFIFVGSYDDSSRLEHLKQVGVTHLLNVSNPVTFLALPVDAPLSVLPGCILKAPSLAWNPLAGGLREIRVGFDSVLDCASQGKQL